MAPLFLLLRLLVIHVLLADTYWKRGRYGPRRGDGMSKRGRRRRCKSRRNRNTGRRRSRSRSRRKDDEEEEQKQQELK